MAIQQPIYQEEQQEQQFVPTLTRESTRRHLGNYRNSPGSYDVDSLRQHANYYNLPFYEGEFGLIDAVKQAAGGFFEGFTTLRIADPPDNEYEAIARNIGHLAGFVPGLIGGPLKSLGVLTKSAGLIQKGQAISGVKSIPMLGADFITKAVKKNIVKPALKASVGSRYSAMDTASKFMLGEKAKHITEGAFHLGTASAISSVWDGVDQMMHSFIGGAGAGAGFRLIGNVVPGTKTGDKVIRGLAGSLFMGLPHTMRGATTPEQIYEYLAGAYFGTKEMPWYRAKAGKFIKKFEDKAKKDVKVEVERDPEAIEGWNKLPEIVQTEVKDYVAKNYGDSAYRSGEAHYLMELFGIRDQIPSDKLESQGYTTLMKVLKGRTLKTRKKAHPDIHIATSGGAKGSDTFWGGIMEKYGVPVIHYLTKGKTYDYKQRGVRGVERELSQKELYENADIVERANRTLMRKIDKLDNKSYELLLRNAMQIRNANSVFAIGEIETNQTGYRAHLNGATVKKGTGWAVQMALDKGLQKVYVFNQTKGNEGWFKWDRGAGRFKPITSTPQLTRNPALIGTRNITAAGKQAIKDVAEATFGEMPKAKSKVPGAVPEETIKEVSPKTAKRLDDLQAEMESAQKQIQDINDVLKEGKVDKVRVKELKKELKQLKNQVKDLDDLKSKHEKLAPNQWMNEAGRVFTEASPGIQSSFNPLSKKGEYFVREHLEDLWKDSVNKRDTILEYGDIIQEIVTRYSGKKGARDKEAIIAINEAVKKRTGLDFKLNSEGEREVKRWIKDLTFSKQVVYARSYGGKTITLIDPKNPVSLSGKSLLQKEPVKLIEEVYNIEGGKLGKNEASLVIFDSVTKRSKRGILNDIPLDKLEDFYVYQQGYKRENAIDAVNKVKSDTINTMYKDYGMYPLGGQGDKGRIVFVKLHPTTQKASKTKVSSDLVKIRKVLKAFDKKATTLLREDRKLAKSEYGISNKEFDRMLHSNVMYDLSLNGFKNTPENIKKVMGKGFIPSAIAYNKRAQIWLTNGHKGDKAVIAEHVKDLVNDKYNYALIADPETPYVHSKTKKQISAEAYKKLSKAQQKLWNKKSSLKALNTELPEHVDGAIIVRDDVVNAINLDAGHPTSGQNKSFIIDPSAEHGALLGKYMFHAAGKTATAEMKKKGLHMMIMTSSAKQIGTREVGDYSVENGKLDIGKTLMYQMDPSSVRYNSSVINDSHMAQKQIWVKQLFTNLHQFGHKTIKKSVIDDIHKEVIEKSFKGDPEMNKKLEEYKRDFDINKIDDLVQNLEKLGTEELISALQTPGAERFAERALQRMLKVVGRDLESQYQEGEITAEERFNAIREMHDVISPMDRLLKNVAIVGEEAAAAGKTGFSGYSHKYIRPYRDAVLHNYFVKSITRPVMDNSAVARIRPYDKFLQAKFPELNKRDDIFYLDSAYKKTKIKLPDGSSTTLEQIWNGRNGKYKDIAKDVMTSIVLRVPMDSISGAHRLEFKGFTGREGHGILMHSRTMRAIGGADLDGDEAFVYFGGRKENGEGFGMKKSWKDAIHAQKEEFYSKGDVKDNKADFRKLLTEGASTDNPLKKSKALYYSPYSRMKASEGAVSGRNMLGVAVSQGQVMKSAYSSIMAAPNKMDKYTTRVWNKQKKKYEQITVERTPKESEAERRYQRELTRAQIAFASDPLDEAGLKGMDVFFNTLHDAYFNTKFYNSKGVEIKKPSNFKDYHLKDGLFGALRDMNRAYFGRNYEEGRRFTMDEVNEKAAAVGKLTTEQLNTILPKMVNTLQGLDWSDNLFRRIDSKRIEQYYNEINAMTEKELGWMLPLMQRKSFKVPYNDHIRTVVENNLDNRFTRREIAQDSSPEGLKNFVNVISGTTWGKKIKSSIERKKMYNFKERKAILDQIARQAEEFITNDLADMATLLNIKRIKDKYKLSGKRIAAIHRQVELLKARSYLNVSERKETNYSSYLGNEKQQEQQAISDLAHKMRIEMKKAAGKSLSKWERKKLSRLLQGDERSSAWDQAQIDNKIIKYMNSLKSSGEKELFEQLMVGTYRRGNLDKLQKWIDKMPIDRYDPIIGDIVNKLVNEASSTSLSRLAFNSQAISNEAIQNHLRSMSDAYSNFRKRPSSEEIKTDIESVNKTAKENNIGEKAEVDDLVEGGLSNKGYAGIKPGEIEQADKDVLISIATRLKKYNNKIGNNLNEILGGILDQVSGKPKDLNAMNKQDFKLIDNYLKEIDTGTAFQSIWGKKGPEIQKRYWFMFPKSVNRELMAYDVKWLKKEGYFLTKDGEVSKNPRIMRRPTYFLEVLQNWIHKSNELARGRGEEFIKENKENFHNLREVKDGNALFQIANAERELGMIDVINGSDDPISLKKFYKLQYQSKLGNIEKEFGVKWKDLQTKKYTTTNDAGNRVTVTGMDLVRGSSANNLTGIKDKISKTLREKHRLIVGNPKEFKKYTTGKFFTNDRISNYEKQTKARNSQPIMNWRKFVKDMGRALERGDDIPMELGIDGMRHIARSMMAELGGKNGKVFEEMIIEGTGTLGYDAYWPHMFFNRKASETSMKEAIKYIKEDMSMSEAEKRKAIANIAIRHKSLTGDWEFRDMQDFDKIDQLDYNKGLKDVAELIKGRKEKIKWTNMNQRFGSMFSRKGHIGGWSSDISVLDAYSKNLANTYYRQIAQIMSRKVLDDAWNRMSHKFGPELASKWQKFFKLYAQGAMGQPDVIPEDIYNDPAMKLKGTPYAWWADNKVLERVNKIREKLGIRKSDLPKELQDFTFQDIRNWSNLEAKFELASLLAHPKSSITNIFGGTLHTIQSAGLPSLRKARDISYLKRINPEWSSMQDVENWVIKKGVVPEYLIHELGIGKDSVTKDNISKLIGELSSKINSNDPIERKKVYELGKKYNIADSIISKAGKFMSIPERILRRDAFMSHYINAWENFGGAIRDPNHPFLIERAKKGVQATQFLYEAPFRPFFARTALGKVMSRFQLFAWNSARFRNDILRQAKRYDFKPGSEAFERYKRTMTIDLFVVALANMFAFSLFDNSLPSPWNWFQDTSEWLFGDEKERDKAFFGMYPGKLAPLQLITPPIARFPISGLRQWIDNDYSKFSDYYVWTLFPFGRLGRDILQKDQGLIDNPMRIMEKFAGMPVMDLARQKAKKEKAKEEGTRYKQPKAGLIYGK